MKTKKIPYLPDITSKQSTRAFDIMNTDALEKHYYFLTTATYRQIVKIIDDASFMYEYPILSCDGLYTCLIINNNESY